MDHACCLCETETRFFICTVSLPLWFPCWAYFEHVSIQAWKEKQSSFRWEFFSQGFWHPWPWLLVWVNFDCFLWSYHVFTECYIIRYENEALSFPMSEAWSAVSLTADHASDIGKLKILTSSFAPPPPPPPLFFCRGVHRVTNLIKQIATQDDWWQNIGMQTNADKKRNAKRLPKSGKLTSGYEKHQKEKMHDGRED